MVIPRSGRIWVLAAFAAGSAAAQSPVVVGQTISLHSGILKEDRLLFVAKPAGYEDGKEGYPVLYLLDGETHFPYASGMAAFLAASDRMPNMIVVGIASGTGEQRTRDLTPPSTAELDNRFSPGNGGAERFLAFVAGELIPFVERSYRTRPYRILFGHSFGGLFAVYSLIHRPALFQAYLLADPSVHWNNGRVNVEAQEFLRTTKTLQADVYLAGSGDSGGPSTPLRSLSDRLEKATPAGFRWKFDWIQKDDHASIPLPAIYNGLENIFEDWRLSDPVEWFDRGGLPAIHQRFRDAGLRHGYPERTTPPFTISLVVAALLRAGRLEDAVKVLLDDPKTYPPPWNQLDAVARGYEARGDTERAVRYYRQSLERNPGNDFARKKIAELESR